MNMKRILPILCALLFALLLLLHPDTAADAVESGVMLCVQTVIPSLFPFFAVMSFLLQLGLDGMLNFAFAPLMRPLFHLRGACAAPLLAGLLGGYPTGAKTAAELYGQGVLTRDEAELLLGFCNNCGPGFLVSFAGATILGSTGAGLALLAIHVASALLTGVILCRLPRAAAPQPLPCTAPMPSPSLPQAFTASVSSALTSTLGICAYVVLFRTIAALLPALPAAVLGGVELVSGMAALTKSNAGFVMAAAFAAWGGLSVHCQTLSVTGELSLKYHTLGKVLQTALSAALAAAWVILMRDTPLFLEAFRQI